MGLRYLILILLLAIVVAFVTAYIYSFKLQNKSEVKGLSTSEAIRQTALSIWQSCHGETAQCYEEGAREELVNEYSTSEILGALYDYDQHFSCHGFIHYVGRALYFKYGNIWQPYSEIDFTCHGGAYHGVIEAYLSEREGSWEDIEGEEILEVCSDSFKKSDRNPVQIFNECLHGMGHAFMFLSDSDLPKSLDYCDRLADIGNRETCYGGAFMENSTSSTNVEHPSAWLSADDKFYPCSILPESQLNQCYLYQANYWIKESNYDWTGVFKNCAELWGSWRDYCHLGIGSNLAGFSTVKGIPEAAEVCSMPDYKVGVICVEGSIPSLISRYGGEVSKAQEFCEAVNSELAEHCFVKMGAAARGWGHEIQKVSEICRKTGDFEKACLGATEDKPRF